MRHLGSLIAGLVAVPLGWLLLAFGQHASAEAFAAVPSTGTYHTHDFLRPLIFLAAAGIAVGLIASLRISPLGPLVAGVAFAGSYVALLVQPKRMVDALNYNVKIVGQTADLKQPLVTGTSLAIGALLLVAVVSAGRWRRWPRPAGEAPLEGAEPTEPDTLADDVLSGGSPSVTRTGAWNAFSSAKPAEPEPTLTAPASTELPVRTPAATWPATRAGQDETTETVPVKGRSPWDTPLRDPTENQ